MATHSHGTSSGASVGETPSTDAHSAGPYFLVFAALMALLVLTVGMAFVDLGVFNFPIAAAIATVKALLVVLIFMHLRDSSRLTWLFAGAALIWLAMMFVLTLNDSLTRDAVPLPPAAAWPDGPADVK